jgi:hypothetical protein
MGWKWSMLACHGVLCHVLILALQLGFGMSAQEAAERFLLDGRPGVVLAPGKPCCFPYVDNGNVACWDAVDAKIMHSSFVAILGSLGILFRTECSGLGRWDTIGLSFSAECRYLSSKPSRMWRIRGALLELYKQARSTPKVVEQLLGHVFFCLLPCRCLLSIPEELYKFAHGTCDVVQHFNRRALDELNVLAAILPFAGCDLGLPFSSTVFCSDSSLLGYALHYRLSDCSLVSALGSALEK